MLKLFLLIAAFLFFGCTNSFHSPDNKEIQEAVKSMYEKRNEADGGGGWVVNNVDVIKSWPGDDKRHYNAQVSVKGVHTSPPLANPVPDEPIDETKEVVLIWRGGKWIIDTE